MSAEEPRINCGRSAVGRYIEVFALCWFSFIGSIDLDRGFRAFQGRIGRADTRVYKDMSGAQAGVFSSFSFFFCCCCCCSGLRVF